MSTNLETNIPDLYVNAIALYGDTQVIVTVLLVIGFGLKVGQSMFGDPSQMLRALLGVSIVVVMIEVLPELANDIQLFGHAFTERIGASPASLYEAFAELILSSGSEAGESIGFWDVILGRDVGLGEAISYALVYLASQ